mgnify:CR=1 FL=1
MATSTRREIAFFATTTAVIFMVVFDIGLCFLISSPHAKAL